MTPGILAARRQTALAAIVAAATTLASRHGLPDFVRPRTVHMDTDVAQMMELEAIAAFFDHMVEGPTAPYSEEDRQAELTVGQLAEQIGAADVEALDAIEYAELGGKNRKGVFDAIAARRAQLDAEAAAAAVPDASTPEP